MADQTRTELPDGCSLSHDRGSIDIHEVAPGVFLIELHGLATNYWPELHRFYEQRIRDGFRLVLFADFSKLLQISTEQRRLWAEWARERRNCIDVVGVLHGTIVGRLAAETSGAISGFRYEMYRDREAFTGRLEALIVKRWAEYTAAPESFPLGRLNRGLEAAQAPPAFGSPAERERALARLEQALFGGNVAPQKIGRFEVLGKLGEGGMGIVLRCYDPNLGREVALKLLRQEGDSGARKRLLREAQALAQLGHPHVVRVYETGQDRDSDFLVMELVEGCTLTEYVRTERPDRGKRLELLRQAARGLQAVHEKGLAHRDLKPDNIMIGADNRVVVVDFGLARGTRSDGAVLARPGSVGRLTATGVVVGTPAYMAPEQLLGASGDALSDQFAFCCTAFEALYGTRPFAGKDAAEVARATLKGAPVAVADPAPRRVHAALMRGLSANPEQRFSCMGELLAELD